MKKEIIGIVKSAKETPSPYDWTFETEDNQYSGNVLYAIDEILNISCEDGEKYRIAVEKM